MFCGPTADGRCCLVKWPTYNAGKERNPSIPSVRASGFTDQILMGQRQQREAYHGGTITVEQPTMRLGIT